MTDENMLGTGQWAVGEFRPTQRQEATLHVATTHITYTNCTQKVVALAFPTGFPCHCQRRTVWEPPHGPTKGTLDTEFQTMAQKKRFYQST